VALASPVDEGLPFAPSSAFPPDDRDPIKAEFAAVAAEEDAPDEFAVSKVFVPGAVGNFAELPPPLGIVRGVIEASVVRYLKTREIAPKAQRPATLTSRVRRSI
jgi:hypothetical protein